MSEIDGTDSQHSIQSAYTGMYCGVDASSKLVRCDRYSLGGAAYRFTFEQQAPDAYGDLYDHLVVDGKQCTVTSANALKCDAITGDDFIIQRPED